MIMTFEDVLNIKNGKNQKAVENPDGTYPIYGSGGIMGYADQYICDSNTVIIGRKGSINNPIFVETPFWNVDTAFGLVAKPDKLIPKYLYYFCKYFDFDKLNTTVTIPSLTKANLLKIKIKVPELDQQKKEVEVLDKVNQVIESRRTQLKDLDNLIKSRFVEMFGDPITNPNKWNKYKLKDVCKINPKKSDDSRLIDNVQISFVAMPSVSEKGDIDTSIIKSYEEVKSGFTYFAEKDVLFAKITPCMENGKGAVAVGLKNGMGFGSTEFHVIRPIESMTNPYWVYYLTMFEFFRNDAERKMTGSAGQRRVPTSFLEDFYIGVPPIDIQNQFAAFVQHVNKLKFEVQKSLDETQLLFDLLMQKYFE